MTELDQTLSQYPNLKTFIENLRPDLAQQVRSQLQADIAGRKAVAIAVRNLVEVLERLAGEKLTREGYGSVYNILMEASEHVSDRGPEATKWYEVHGEGDSAAGHEYHHMLYRVMCEEAGVDYVGLQPARL